jgi:hypothetical protein
MPEQNEQHGSKVFELLLAGLSGERIAEWARSDKNKIGLRAEDLPDLIRNAEARLREYSKFQFDTELGKSLQRLNELYARCIQIQDFKGAAGIERERARLLQTNRRPEETEEVQTPARLQPLQEVAELLNIAPRTLQRWCRGDDPAHQPPIAHEARPGQRERFALDPAAASRHLQQHARRLPAGFRPYPTPNTTTGAADPTTDGAADPMTTVRDLLQKITLSPERLASTPPDLIRALTAVESAVLRRESAEAKRALAIAPEQYAKDLRALAQILAGEMSEASPRRLAGRLLTVLRQNFGVDLPAAQAAGVLEREIQEDHQRTLDNWQRHVTDQLRNVQTLPGTV